MSAVFEFDDLPSTQVSKENLESGYSSDTDAAEPKTLPLDEKLYEVELGENFISSSLKTTPAANTHRK
ncbi:hypothetical protein CU098_013257, partial [Rhizopus stolonifer]